MTKYTNDILEKELLDLQIIPKEKIENAFEMSQSTGVPIESILVEQNLISDENLTKLIASITSVPYITLSQKTIDNKILQIIPEVVARKNRIVSFDSDEKGLHVATTLSDNDQIVKFLGRKTGEPVNVYLTTKKELEGALNLYLKDVGGAFDEIIEESIKKAKGNAAKEPSIIKIVDTVIFYADSNKASDIHIEPYENIALIRFRIDGILHDIYELPKDLHPQIVTRIKVLAKLRTDEHSMSQDGKIEFQRKDAGHLDIRVSIVPITNGEKVVMRLLSEKSRQFSLSELGIQKADLAKITDAYTKPHGMILSTGPTGSGKTTTLYSILKILNKRDINIMTIEDPVEYSIEGVNQIQVNEKTGLTFANGLRSIVRQDPDIILVGEIRDEETADISINAAMTGHLVLSTLHTNDAATAIPRLLDLKVEPFLVASTVNVIIAQRLVRVICDKCRYSKEIDDKDRNDLKNIMPSDIYEKYFPKSAKVRTYRGKGCPVCHMTGYVGRIGLYEVLIIDEKIKEAITLRKDASTIEELGKKNGMASMFEDGVNKVLQGVTTIEEILRVTKV